MSWNTEGELEYESLLVRVCFLLFVHKFRYGFLYAVCAAFFRIFTKILLLCFLMVIFFWFERLFVHSFGRSFSTLFYIFLLLLLLSHVVICSLYTSHFRFSLVFFFLFLVCSFFIIYILRFLVFFSIHTRYEIVLSLYRLSHFGLSIATLNAIVHSKQYYRNDRAHIENTYTYIYSAIYTA